jgi:hypothetical protein
MDFQDDTLAVIPNHQEKNLLGMVKGVLDPGRHQGVPVVHIAVSVRSDYADAPARTPALSGGQAGGCAPKPARRGRGFVTS